MLIDHDVLVVVCNYKSADDGDDGANGRALNMFSVRLCQRRSAESIRIGPDGYGDDGLAPASPPHHATPPARDCHERRVVSGDRGF